MNGPVRTIFLRADQPVKNTSLRNSESRVACMDKLCRHWGRGDYESACREHGFKPWAGANSKRGPVLSHPMWQIFSCTRPPCLGCGDWRSGHAPSGLGRRRLASWSCACSRLRAGSMRSTTCAVCAWVCLTGSAHLVRPLGTGCPSECGSFVEFRQKMQRLWMQQRQHHTTWKGGTRWGTR